MGTHIDCPNCSADMDRFGLEGVYGPDVDVDVCFSCHAMWLDKRESIQLSPRGTLDLFRVLNEHEDDPRHALGSRMECPRCRARLALAHDIGKAGRFSYYACPKRHGRLTPFSEFLKEKQFVRSLTPPEQHRLRAEVKQVQCSSCGARVDLAQGFQCEHCGSPLTVLDADAVEKTLHELEAADARRSADPVEVELQARKAAALERLRASPEGRWQRLAEKRADPVQIDLLSSSIRVIFGGF